MSLENIEIIFSEEKVILFFTFEKSKILQVQNLEKS